MRIVGGEYVQSLADGRIASLKMVFNGCGAIIFPACEQHRDHKAPGLSYEDNYKGNALAAMLSDQRIEVRFHHRFSASQVSNMLAMLMSQPDLACLRCCELTYQGKVLDSHAVSRDSP